MSNTVDRFLKAHRFQELCYQISEGIAPVSIRDQMVRAQMLVDRILSTAEVPEGVKCLLWAAALQVSPLPSESHNGATRKRGRYMRHLSMCMGSVVG